MLGKWTPRRVLNARTLAWSVVLMALAAGPGVSAATGATTPDPKRRLISLRVYYNGSGTYTRTVPDG